MSIEPCVLNMCMCGQGKIDFSYPEASEELRLELDGVHFVSNGSIYALAKPSGYVRDLLTCSPGPHIRTDHRHGIDLRNVLSMIPPSYVNNTARIVEEEMSTRIERLKEKIELGIIEDAPVGTCCAPSSILELTLVSQTKVRPRIVTSLSTHRSSAATCPYSSCKKWRARSTTRQA